MKTLERQVGFLKTFAQQSSVSSDSASMTLAERISDTFENEDGNSSAVAIIIDELEQIIIVAKYLLMNLKKM